MSVIQPFMFTARDDRNVMVRSLEARDAQAALDFLDRVLKESDSLMAMPGELAFTRDEEAEVIRRFANDSGSLMFGAFEGERCVAICTAERSRRFLKLGHHAEAGLSVLAGHRGVGVGSRMMRTLCAWADEHAFVEKLTLSVMADNPVAAGLYKRFHFVQVGKLSQHIRQPDGRYVDHVLMERYRRVPVGRLATE